tara:strand:+ start:560 stop:1018 length:459 start_codon:yes stop_codon:yes gene_type:complete
MFPVINNDQAHASLAAELATKLHPVKEILARHNVTSSELLVLMTDSQFKHMIREYRREWNSPLSARERVRMKSSLAVEDGLVELYRVFQDKDIQPNARMDAFKQLVGLADMQPKKEAGELGPSFSLTLNLGGDDASPITIEHAPTKEVTDGS